MPTVTESKQNTATVGAVYAAICRITGELSKDGISKNRRNQQQGYQFRGIDDVYNALSSLLAVHQLCILPEVLRISQTERVSKDGKILFAVRIKVAFDFVSAIDGSRHRVTTYGEAMDSADKATNKSMSAAYKYAALMAFCIPTEGDHDIENSTHEVRPRQPENSAPMPVMEELPKRTPLSFNEVIEWITKFLPVFEKFDGGHDAYYLILGNNGLTAASEIPDPKTAGVVFTELKNQYQRFKQQETAA